MVVFCNWVKSAVIQTCGANRASLFSAVEWISQVHFNNIEVGMPIESKSYCNHNHPWGMNRNKCTMTCCLEARLIMSLSQAREIVTILKSLNVITLWPKTLKIGLVCSCNYFLSQRHRYCRLLSWELLVSEKWDRKCHGIYNVKQLFIYLFLHPMLVSHSCQLAWRASVAGNHLFQALSR